jgi:predicted acetyltransferase
MREPRLLGRAMIRADDETVNVSLASGAERTSIERLLQFYIYDFSELEPPGSDDLEFDDQGSYAPFSGIESYWRVDGFRPLLIRVKERLAGFALINTSSRASGRVDHNVAEFFVARKYRRCGVATEAVRQVLVRYPGHWEIAVAERNVAARVFWPHAIGAAQNVSQLVHLAGDGKHWRGRIWSFRAA